MTIYKRTINGRIWLWMVIVGLFAGLAPVAALENGVGRTPAMGFNPWNSFLGTPTLDTLKDIVDAMASNGMRDAGYVYMCFDGGQFRRNGDSGIQEFVDYCHARGFKAGFYVNKDARDIQDSLARKWARMGFDYLKHDDYWVPWWHPTYVAMRNALNNCGRDVYYTIHFATDSGMPLRPDTLCHAMRTANDINWKKDSLYWGPRANCGDGVMGEVMASRKFQQLARPGYFNDMDMMGVGMTKFITTVEAQTHFNFWCIMASILLEGSDVRRIPADRLAILLNREVIAVNQDSLGEQGRVVWSKYAAGDSTEVISKRMKDGSRAVMLFNRHGPTKSITVRLSDIGLTGPVHVRDLLRHENLPLAADSVTIAGIVQHGSAMLLISKNPVSSIYRQPLKVAELKNSAARAPAVRLIDTRITSCMPLLSGHTGLEVYNLQGVRLWKSYRGRTEGGVVRIPKSIKNGGMAVVRFVK
jgi:alpha-galactosidase